MAFIKKINTDQDLTDNLERVVPELKSAIQGLEHKTAELVLYWLNTWSNEYLPNEKNFDYESLIAYKRASVVQAHFGFKVGSEQGGLHYALIMENDNDKRNKTVMCIPLASLPENKKPEDIGNNEIFLGYSLFKEDIERVEKKVEKDEKLLSEFQAKGKNTQNLEKTIHKNKKKLEKWSRGTVALVNQMCALSKIRIYTPKHMGGELAKFRLNDEKMKLVDEKVKEMYLTKNEES
ncbi:type II toxin-antitoxin system PemK/MazF family toxin [Priestia megaterium]